MKYKLYYTLLLFILTLSSFSQKGKFILKGKIGTISSPATIALSYRVADSTLTVNSEMKSGNFNLQGSINEPTVANLTLNYNEKDKMGMAVQIWLEPGTIVIISVDDLTNSTITGSKLNDLGKALNERFKPSLDKLDAWIKENEFLEKKDPETYKLQKEKQLADLDERNKTIMIEFIKENPDSMFSLSLIDISLSRGVPDISLVSSLFNGLSNQVKESSYGKKYKQKLENWQKVDIGSVAPNFTQPDQKGNLINLSDFKGKYVLVDFWASWCHPCREENPNLLEQYKKYKKDGFEVLGVSLDGGGFGTKESWIKAIEKDGVGVWTNVCDLSGSTSKNAVKMLYGVGSIPENFLIDPQGKIIAKSLRGEKLNSTLEELFFKKSVSELQNNSEIPLDATVRKGVLENGFTYYIKKNQTPKERVVFYLANKVGSISEEDNQQGLAHFLEHMNFNGTTHFPKNKLIDYLQSLGVQFGADLNAYTGFNETVYQLPLPGNTSDMIDNGLKVMRDWAKGALLELDEIDNERGVILEEKRTRKGAGERINKQVFPIITNDSRYAQRFPIGQEKIIENFKAKDLISFYNDWYRPDLQALLVVGDVDVDKMENEIKKRFSDLKNPDNARKRTEYTIPLTNKNQFAQITDNEVNQTSIDVISKTTSKKLKTVADLNEVLLGGLFNKMINARIMELLDGRSAPPFLSAGAGIGTYEADLQNFTATVNVKRNETEKGFKSLWREIERVRRFGFTETEIQRAKENSLSQIQSAVENKPDNSSLIKEYLQHFLYQTAAPDKTTELLLTEKYLSGLKKDDFDQIIKKYIKSSDRDIIVIGPALDKAVLPKEKEINKWMAEVEKEDLIAYVDKFYDDNLLIKTPQTGEIIKETKIESIDADEWTLSNGAKVIIKKTDNSKDYELFRAFSQGGASNYSEDEYLSAVHAGSMVTMAGLGNYNFNELSKYVAGKDLFVSNEVADYKSEMQGGFVKKVAGDFFKIIYAKFVEPSYNPISFKTYKDRLYESIRNKSIAPESVFNDTIKSVVSNYNARKMPLTESKLEKFDFERGFKIYNEQFIGNTSNFVFVFVGPISKDSLRPLVEKYIASIPSGNSHNNKVQDLGIHPVEGKITKEVYKGLEKKSIVYLTFSGKFDYNLINNKSLEALKEIIKINLLERLREKEKGVYTPSVYFSSQKVPDMRYKLTIQFECAPENVDKLINASLEEIENIKKNGPTGQSVDKFKAEDISSNDLKFQSDFNWLEYIQNQLINNDSIDELNQYRDVLNKINPDTLKSAAQKYLSGENLIRFILKPEK